MVHSPSHVSGPPPPTSIDEASRTAFGVWVSSSDGIGPQPKRGETWETDAQNEWALRKDSAESAWEAGVAWARKQAEDDAPIDRGPLPEALRTQWDARG